VFYGGAKKADWDVGMAVDAIKLAPRLDAIVLATGDGDFIPLVEYLKAHGTQVEVISFGKSSSGKLKEVADEFIDMGEAPRKFLLVPPRFNLPGTGRRDQEVDSETPAVEEPKVVGADE
jgi:uncharacterized LabA/DUF88 family protein